MIARAPCLTARVASGPRVSPRRVIASDAARPSSGKLKGVVGRSKGRLLGLGEPREIDLEDVDLRARTQGNPDRDRTVVLVRRGRRQDRETCQHPRPSSTPASGGASTVPPDPALGRACPAIVTRERQGKPPIPSNEPNGLQRLIFWLPPPCGEKVGGSSHHRYRFDRPAEPPSLPPHSPPRKGRDQTCFASTLYRSFNGIGASPTLRKNPDRRKLLGAPAPPSACRPIRIEL